MRRVSYRQPQVSPQFIYDITDWCQFAGAAAFDLFLPTAEQLDEVLFLYRPASRRLFWTLVQHERMLAFEFLGAAAAGLLMLPGCWQPRCIIYDIEAAERMHHMTFRDPIKVQARKREKHAREAFERLVLCVHSGPKAPLFTTAIKES